VVCNSQVRIAVLVTEVKTRVAFKALSIRFYSLTLLLPVNSVDILTLLSDVHSAGTVPVVAVSLIYEAAA
jgi:hypothetical protein